MKKQIKNKVINVKRKRQKKLSKIISNCRILDILHAENLYYFEDIDGFAYVYFRNLFEDNALFFLFLTNMESADSYFGFEEVEGNDMIWEGTEEEFDLTISEYGDNLETSNEDIEAENEEFDLEIYEEEDSNKRSGYSDGISSESGGDYDSGSSDYDSGGDFGGGDD